MAVAYPGGWSPGSLGAASKLPFSCGYPKPSPVHPAIIIGNVDKMLYTGLVVGAQLWDAECH